MEDLNQNAPQGTDGRNKNPVITVQKSTRKIPGIFLVAIVAVVVIIVVFAGQFLPNKFSSSDTLISGVPYYGFINTYPDYGSVAVTSVATILGYYGDERFTFDDLLELFPPGSQAQGKGRGTPAFQIFFEQAGYTTELVVFNEENKGGEISEIKKFKPSLDERKINPDILNLLPEEVAKQKRAIPFAKLEDGSVAVAMEDPSNLIDIEFLERYIRTKIVP